VNSQPYPELATGQLVESDQPIPGTRGLIIRSNVLAYLVITPWPLRPSPGPGIDVAVVIDAADGSGIKWAKPIDVNVDEIQGAGSAGSIGYVRLDQVGLTDAAVPKVTNMFGHDEFVQALDSANGDVRVALTTVNQQLAWPTGDVASTSITNSQASVRANAYRRISIPNPRIKRSTDSAAFSICEFLLLD
jgi:hypothetical protein